MFRGKRRKFFVCTGRGVVKIARKLGQFLVSCGILGSRGGDIGRGRIWFTSGATWRRFWLRGFSLFGLRSEPCHKNYRQESGDNKCQKTPSGMARRKSKQFIAVVRNFTSGGEPARRKDIRRANQRRLPPESQPSTGKSSPQDGP